MINDSRSEYIFIRICIFGLHNIVPICAAYTIALISLYGTKAAFYRVPIVIECVALAETLFFLLVYLPYSYYRQHEAVHPAPPPRAERKLLFELCNENTEDSGTYLRRWFLGAELEEIKRENVKEFLLWAFFNRGGPPGDDDEELEEYVQIMEKKMGRGIPPGRGNAKCLRLTLDKVIMMRRSLCWYFCVGVVDLLTYITLLYHGFHFHRTSIPSLFKTFPFRFQALTTPYTSPAKHTTYWHRPHTSKTRLPLVFIHGIGIGLYPYTNFLSEINNTTSHDPNDQIGILAIEIMPVSFRICHAPLGREALVAEINAILEHHGFDKFVLASHSYGSVITTHLLKSEVVSPKIAATVLIDPVSILLHLPDVAYNFTRRQPRRANEWQLYYFGSMDMGVSHALGRHFFWSECVLWKRDIVGRNVTVGLASRDLIVDTVRCGRYLMSDSKEEDVDGRLRGGESGESSEGEGRSINPSSSESSEGGWIDETGRKMSARKFENEAGDVKEPNVSVTEETGVQHGGDSWKNREWTGKGIDVLWFDGIDHAQVFDARDTRARLIRVIDAYCRQEYS